jgi:uncharacterized protein
MSAWLEMVEGLRRGAGWPEEELPVEMVQTHISVVLLGRRHVLKLKKPVDFGFLDYTTLDKRRRACEAEVALNRRLCPDTYLGVRKVLEAGGRPQLAEAGEAVGEAVDYGVWMKRLPAGLMLDRLVAEGKATERVIDAVAERLVPFHREARRGPEVDFYASPATVRFNWEENFSQTAPFVGRTIEREAHERIHGWVTEWLGRNERLLQERVRGGHVCEGHGDVRCESVCVTDPVRVFDCVEFNERFRCGDVAGEVAFLSVDLDARGRPDLGHYFAEVYARRSGDARLFHLLPFYRCYRAYVRGKVLSFRLGEPEFDEAARAEARRRARGFFDLALRYATPLRRPTVVAVAGLSGSGKTTVARAVAGELGLRVVSADAVRKSLFGDTKGSAYGEGPYGPEANRLTYERLLEEGRKLLTEDGGVVLDATFRREADRAAARLLAAEAGADWRLIECRLAPDEARARLERRAAGGEGLSDATWDTHVRQRAEFDAIGETRGATYLPLDAGGEVAELGRRAADWLRRAGAGG